MSFIVALITKDAIVMGADKRETFVDGSGYRDTCRKIHKKQNGLYGMTGSGELIKYFEQHDRSNNIVDFIEFSNDTFNKFEQTKTIKATYENWIRQKFDLSLITAGILDEKPFASIHQITWKEKGILYGSVPSTRNVPMFVMPAIGADFVETYIKKNHPDTLEDAEEVIDFLMKKVSSLNIDVSPQYDMEVLKLY
jgi:hypothetical protein